MGGKGGKALKKKKRAAARFDPLARPSDMSVDSEAAPVKQLSAHQQRHLERKKLQAEKVELQNLKRKVRVEKSCYLQGSACIDLSQFLLVAQVSKADKLAWKKETKVRTEPRLSNPTA